MPPEAQSARAVVVEIESGAAALPVATPQTPADSAPARTESVKVSIGKREYTVACTPDERDGVEAAATHLDQQMREILHNGRAPNHERCAIAAALNISHELLELRQRVAAADATQARLARLSQRIDDALAVLRRAQSKAESDSDSDSN